MTLNRKSNIAIFADIDHTLAHPGIDNDNHISAINNPDGSSMVMTRQSHNLFIDLLHEHWFVPTTARCFDQYSTSIFNQHCKVSITDNGGQVNIDGKSSDIWKALIKERIDQIPEGYKLEQIGSLVASCLTGFTFNHSFDYGMYWAFIFDPNSFNRTLIESLIVGVLPPDYTFGFYKHTLYVNPVAITKIEAVKFVHQYLSVDCIFATGDSMNDKSMMEYADCGIVSPFGDLIEQDLLSHDHGLVIAPDLGTRSTEWILNNITIQIKNRKK
jgi:haloacid dehalogenase-like hydrolase